MVGIFDKYEDVPGVPLFVEQYGVNTSDEVYMNMPLPFSPDSLSKQFHKRAKKKGLMSISATSPGFKKLVKKFGKTSKGRPSSKPIDFVVYNDASRPATANEKSQGINEIYYPKFVEYGFTDRAGNWHDGHRLYAKTRDQFRQMLVEEYRKLPSKFVRDDIYIAFENAVKRYLKLLEEVTPVDSGLMKKSWDYRGHK